METTKIYKNWSRPDVFEVSRDMLRDFARSGGIVMNSTDVSEIIEFGAYVIVSASSSFGQGYDGVKFGTYINSEFNTYLDVQEHMQKTAAYYDSFEIDNILKDNIWTDFPIANHYEVWHIVDECPDWLPPVVAFAEVVRGADSFLRSQSVVCSDVTAASDYDAGGTFVELYVFEGSPCWCLLGLMRMPWKPLSMDRIFNITASFVSKLGYSFAFRRFDVMCIESAGMPDVFAVESRYLCMSEDYSELKDSCFYDPIVSRVDPLRDCDVYDDDVPF